MDGTPRKPWWRRKRWWAASIVAMLVWYPVSSGPYYYVTGRYGWGFLGHDPMHRIGGYEPVVTALQALDALVGRFGWSPRLYSRWAWYNSECDYAGERHAESD